MRTLLLLAILLFALPVVAQEHSQWQTVRSEADGFSIELPGTAKIETRDLGNGATQKNYTVEAGAETYMASVIYLGQGRGQANPDEPYFAILMKAYVDGSKTTLRSSRMMTWVGYAAMEGIADAPEAAHLIDITAVGDRLYLIVYAGPKGQENTAKGRHLRDSFKLLAN